MENFNFDSEQVLQNNMPVENFCGLTTNEIGSLLDDPFGEKSPLRFRSFVDNKVFDQIPLFRIAEEFLKIVQREKQIKLTPLGALPKKVVVELYDHSFLPDYLVERGTYKLWKEADCISIFSARHSVLNGRLVRKSNNKLSLSKIGTKLLLRENRFELFKAVLASFALKFNWAVNDGHVEEPIAQYGFAFSLYLLDKFGGKKQRASFYAEKYFVAFPASVFFFVDTRYQTALESFSSCYELRTFDRFLVWFGLVSLERKGPAWHREDYWVVRSKIFQEIFEFD